MKHHQPNPPKSKLKSWLLTLAEPGRVQDHTHHVYQTDGRGVFTRLAPSRPWRGKSERRQVLKARRLARNGEV